MHEENDMEQDVGTATEAGMGGAGGEGNGGAAAAASEWVEPGRKRQRSRGDASAGHARSHNGEQHRRAQKQQRRWAKQQAASQVSSDGRGEAT